MNLFKCKESKLTEDFYNWFMEPTLKRIEMDINDYDKELLRPIEDWYQSGDTIGDGYFRVRAYEYGSSMYTIKMYYNYYSVEKRITYCKDIEKIKSLPPFYILMNYIIARIQLDTVSEDILQIASTKYYSENGKNNNLEERLDTLEETVNQILNIVSQINDSMIEREAKESFKEHCELRDEN